MNSGVFTLLVKLPFQREKKNELAGTEALHSVMRRGLLRSSEL